MGGPGECLTALLWCLKVGTGKKNVTRKTNLTHTTLTGNMLVYTAWYRLGGGNDILHEAVVAFCISSRKLFNKGRINTSASQQYLASLRPTFLALHTALTHDVIIWKMIPLGKSWPRMNISSKKITKCVIRILIFCLSAQWNENLDNFLIQKRDCRGIRFVSFEIRFSNLNFSCPLSDSSSVNR